MPPATMTRLAKRIGLDGHESVRELYAGAMRDGTLGFARKAGAQVEAQKPRGESECPQGSSTPCYSSGGDGNEMKESRRRIPGLAASAAPFGTSCAADISSANQRAPEALAAHHKAEIDKWWPLVKAAGIKAE